METCTDKLLTPLVLISLMCCCRNGVSSTGETGNNHQLVKKSMTFSDAYPVTELSDVIAHVLRCEFEGSFMILHDDITIQFKTAIVEELSFTGNGSYLYMIDMSCNTMLQETNLLSKNILVIAGTYCLHRVLQWASAIDNNHTLGTYIRHKSRWFIVTYESQLTAIKVTMAQFDHVSVLIVKGCDSLFGCSPSLAKNVSRSPEYEIVTLMWQSAGRTWENAVVQMYSKSTSCKQSVFQNTKFGFNGREFQVTTMPKLDDRYNKISFTDDNFFIESGATFRQRYRINEPPDGQWGSVVNGKWTGIVRQLIAKEVDLAVTALTVDFARNQVIDFVSPSFFYDSKDIMYKTPDSSQSRWRLLLDVYKPEVLLCLGVSTITCTVLLSIMENMKQRKTTRQHLANLWLYLEQIWCSLLHQSSILRPRSWSGRVLMCWWLLFGIVVSSTYTANLMAFLAVPISKKPFTSLSEMLQNTDFRWGFVGGGSMQTSLSTSSDPGIQALWRAAVKFNQTDSRTMTRSVDAHLNRVMTESYAYIAGHEKYGSYIDCYLSYVGEKLFQYEYSTGLPDGSPLKEDFDDVMSRMWENGLLKLLNRKWLNGGNTCVTMTTESQEVVLMDVLGLFCIGGVGIGLSFTILFAECIFISWQKYRA